MVPMSHFTPPKHPCLPSFLELGGSFHQGVLLISSPSCSSPSSSKQPYQANCLLHLLLSIVSRRRGLNPPHRVKSISMTTFTEPEVVFLQSRGNEVCRKIWLGLFDARTSLIPDSRDPQKVKEFLQEKYEKKRW